MKFKLTNDYIALGQLLKACDVVSSGGEVKYFLANCPVFLNGEKEDRRGKKIYAGDVVEADGIRIEVE
ncbi:RNA-binding S4 domain-containing protein [Dubosiella newyorkensis]|jgi:ribosome-associated protein|uniref:Uncharacterized protein n=1 Tax=Dubosiella newyorkensis TaxID=1862672 RepID=A0A1U7NPM9_9FIRM|nr:RNA-binding S4 domain-containing protein [Dubosiella newyorkensis]MCI9040251.1 RNA-binding S4 domain-containing protein [Dubosiella newyorkensis]OLU47596.1 hypothetical protein BO225_01760 [Dubosiella newyorkensis]